MVMSDDRVDAGGLGLGAAEDDGAGGTAGAEDDGLSADAAGFVSLSPALGPGSLILLLENIFCCLDIDHRVDGLAADAHFIVKMRSG